MLNLKYCIGRVKKWLPFKLIIITFSLQIMSCCSNAQDFGGNKVGIANFVRRMYNSQAFDGVKVLQTQEGQDYMVSVVALKNDSSTPPSIQSRIASIKAKAYVSQYINGTVISSEVVIITTEQKMKDSTINKTQMQEVLKESSMGFAGGMELLINFETNDKKQVVYVFYKEIDKLH